MASYKKRGNSWQATIFVGRDSDGKQIFEYVTRDTLKECKSEARQIEQDIADGKFVRINNIRVTALIEKHFKVNRADYSPSTRSLYDDYFECYYKPFFGNKKVKEITEYDAREFRSSIIEKCPGSARRIFSVIKKVFKDAMKEKSPFKDVKLPEETKVTYKVPEADDFEKIHEVVIGTNDEPKILCAGWGGLRRGEIFALKPDDLNFNNNTIRVDEDYVINEEGEYEFTDPKSENGFREVVVPPYLMELLKPIAEERQRELLSTDLSKLEEKEIEEIKRIFKGRPDNYSSYFAKLIRKKNLPKTRFHDLRHYQACWLFDNGFPDDYAAKRMGQTKEVLRNIYQHLRPQKEKDLDQKITKLHDQRPKKRIKYKGKLKRSI